MSPMIFSWKNANSKSTRTFLYPKPRREIPTEELIEELDVCGVDSDEGINNQAHRMDKLGMGANSESNACREEDGGQGVGDEEEIDPGDGRDGNNESASHISHESGQELSQDSNYADDQESGDEIPQENTVRSGLEDAREVDQERKHYSAQENDNKSDQEKILCDSKESSHNETMSNDKYISRAPLHIAYTHVQKPNARQLRRLVDQGFSINHGQFTPKENKRLLKNWRRFLRQYPTHNNAKLAFGVSSRGANRETVDSYRELRIISRMAYKLDKRLIPDIYARCQRLIAFEQYTITRLKDLREEDRREISQALKKCKNAEICDEYDVSPGVVQKLRQNPKPSKRRHQWKYEHDETLIELVMRMIERNDTKIDWMEVSKLLSKELNIKFNREQCYKRWTRLRKDATTEV